MTTISGGLPPSDVEPSALTAVGARRRLVMRPLSWLTWAVVAFFFVNLAASSARWW